MTLIDASCTSSATCTVMLSNNKLHASTPGTHPTIQRTPPPPRTIRGRCRRCWRSHRLQNHHPSCRYSINPNLLPNIKQTSPLLSHLLRYAQLLFIKNRILRRPTSLSIGFDHYPVPLHPPLFPIARHPVLLLPSEGPRPHLSQQPSASGLEADRRKKAAHTRRLRLLQDRLYRRTQSRPKSSPNTLQQQTPSKPPRRISLSPASEV